MQNLNDLFKSIFSGIQSSIKRINSKIKKLDTDIKNIDIPTSLPNPNALTFTGAVKESYDGSLPKAVNIPTKLPNPNALTVGTGESTVVYDGNSPVNIDLEPIISSKMDKNNPTGTGSFSLNRKAGTVVGAKSHAEGKNTTASGTGSHAEGNWTKAEKGNAHAEGSDTTASGECSHAEGFNTTASGSYSHAEGYSTRANERNSHAEGKNTTASGQAAHAEGDGTTASGLNSHAEGSSTMASGEDSHAEGYNTTASGINSHAEGSWTKALSSNQHVQGKYNIEDSSGVYADVIGNGASSSKRSNAVTVDWSGNAWYAGNVYVGSTSGTNKDGGSKKLATEEYVNNTAANIDIPTTLPNPQSITFTGAAEGTYDGSSALTVDIPSAPEIPTQLPNPQSLTFTGAVNASYDGSSEVSVGIPGALSDLSEDAAHRVVTDAEKAKWNAKSNFSGSYNDLTNKPTIPDVPVQSVNGKTGAVVLSAEDVGALSSSTVIPTALPNPNALTFTGAATGSYDGSNPLTVEIPVGADGKSAYQYAVEGGYTGTETEFAEKLAREQLSGTTDELTPTQVYNAVSAGIPVKVQYTDNTYGLLSFTSFNVAESLDVIVSQTIVYFKGVCILAELNGVKSDNTWYFMSTMLAQKTDIPSALPNPNALTIKIGDTTVTYDGSTAQTMTIADGTEVSY